MALRPIPPFGTFCLGFNKKSIFFLNIRPYPSALAPPFEFLSTPLPSYLYHYTHLSYLWKFVTLKRAEGDLGWIVGEMSLLRNGFVQ